MKIRSVRNGCGGFTLFELLVAMGLTILIVGALGASLYAAFRAESSAVRVVNTNRGVDAALDTLCADLGDAVPPQSATGNTLAGPFQGNNQSLGFSACGMEPGSGVQGNVRLIQIDVEQSPGGGGMELVRRVTTNLLAPVQPVPGAEVLCTHVTGFTIAYFDGTNWDDTWDSTQTQPVNDLPSAVMLTLAASPKPGKPPIQEQRIVPLACAQPTQGLNLP